MPREEHRGSPSTTTSAPDRFAVASPVMNLYDATVPILTMLLANVDKRLDKAAASADTRKFDVEILVNARLAPNQYSFVRQIQAASDQAKFTVAKLTGQQPPS